jgi:hypothetical protein
MPLMLFVMREQKNDVLVTFFLKIKSYLIKNNLSVIILVH